MESSKKDIVEIIQTLCEYKHEEITWGAVVGHAYLCVELSSKYAGSDFIGYKKRKSSLQLFDGHLEFKARGDACYLIIGLG